MINAGSHLSGTGSRYLQLTGDQDTAVTGSGKKTVIFFTEGKTGRHNPSFFTG